MGQDILHMPSISLNSEQKRSTVKQKIRQKKNNNNNNNNKKLET